MKSFYVALAFVLAAGTSVAQDARTPSSTAGRFAVSQYGAWQLHTMNNVSASSQTVYVDNCFPNIGTNVQSFFPLATDAPLTIVDGPNTETVTPSQVNSPRPTQPGDLTTGTYACSFVATFTKAHLKNAVVSSATFGLEEAINDAHAKHGGIASIDASWVGTTAMITVTGLGYSDVTVEDNRAGSVSYSWNGSNYATTAIPLPASSGLCFVSTGNALGSWNWSSCAGLTSSNWSDLTPGTGTIGTGAYHVGTGSTIDATGSGIIAAPWANLSGTPTAVMLAPSANQTLAGGFKLINSGVYGSTVTTGTAPFEISSTTVVPNLNVSQLLGSTWTAPGTIGSGTPSTGAFTTLNGTTGAFTALSGKIVNGVSYSDKYSGATLDVRFNACNSDAANLANGNTTGICDATGETGAQTTPTEVTFGDASGHAVTILLPSTGVWTTTVNDGTHCGFKHYGGASIIGAPASGLNKLMKFANGPSANPLYLYCTDTTGGNYFYASGFNIYNQSLATASGIGAKFEGPFFDATSWDSIYILDGKDTYAAEIHKACCSTSFSKMQFDAEYGSIPLYVLEDDVTGKQEGINFISDTMVKPGSGQPAVKVSDVSHRMTLNFFGSYTETNTSDTTTALWQISGPKAVNITGINYHANVASSTATGITLDNSYNTQLNVTGLTMGTGSGTFTYPATAIVNSFTANTVSTDANGNLGSYLSTPSTIDGILTLRGASSAQLKMGPLTNLSLFNNLSVTDAGSGGVNINIDPTPSAAAQTSQIRVGRGLNNTGGLEFTLFKGDGTATKAFDVLNGVANSWGNRVVDPNQFGALANYSVTPCETSSAPTTLATGAAFTDTTANCLTGNSTILFVTARVTTTITGACTGWSIGDATTTSRFSTNNTTLTAGTSTDAAHIGTYNNTGIASATTGMWQASNAKVRITCAGGNPGAGAIRVEVFAITPTAPTS